MEPLQLVASEGTPSRRGAVQPEPVEAGGGVRAWDDDGVFVYICVYLSL